jgi:hypothetical protein
MIIIIMRGENFVAHLDGLGGTPVCCGTPVAHHCPRGRRSLGRLRKGWSEQILKPEQVLNLTMTMMIIMSSIV